MPARIAVSEGAAAMMARRTTLRGCWPAIAKAALARGLALFALAMLAVFCNKRGSAEDTKPLEESPIYRALHPDLPLGTRTLTFRFGDAVFHVPENYFAGGSDRPQPNEPGYLHIMTLLPDLVPRTPENYAQFVTPGWHDKLRATLHYRRQLSSMSEIVSRILGLYKKAESDFETTPQGFRFYRLNNGSTGDIYVKDTDHGTLMVRCAADGSVPFPDCVVHENFDDQFVVIYAYSKTHLSHAEDIERRVRTLFDSFREPSQVRR
jgi:hypothetical protein